MMQQLSLKTHSPVVQTRDPRLTLVLPSFCLCTGGKGWGYVGRAGALPAAHTHSRVFRHAMLCVTRLPDMR